MLISCVGLKKTLQHSVGKNTSVGSTWSKRLQRPVLNMVLVPVVLWSKTACGGLHICLLMVQPWGSGTVVKEPVRGHDLCETPLTTTESILTERRREFMRNIIRVMGQHGDSWILRCATYHICRHTVVNCMALEDEMKLWYVIMMVFASHHNRLTNDTTLYKLSTSVIAHHPYKYRIHRW